MEMLPCAYEETANAMLPRMSLRDLFREIPRNSRTSQKIKQTKKKERKMTTNLKQASSMTEVNRSSERGTTITKPTSQEIPEGSHSLALRKQSNPCINPPLTQKGCVPKTNQTAVVKEI